MSFEEVEGLGLFYAPLNGSLDLKFVGFIDVCEAEDNDSEKTVERLNLMSLERDRKLNPEGPVPVELDLSDEV